MVWIFEMVSAVLFLKFGVGCLLARVEQPFFVCHRHSWSVLSSPQAHVVSFFHILFCHRHLCWTSCVCLVGTCFGVLVYLRFWYCAVRLLLIGFILGDLKWNFFQVGYPVDSHTNSALKQTAFGIPP